MGGDADSQIVYIERSDSRSMVLCHTLHVSWEDCLCRVFYCVVVVFINVSGHVLDGNYFDLFPFYAFFLI